MQYVLMTQVQSPVGLLTVAGHDEGLCALEFASSVHPVDRTGWEPGSHAVLTEASRQLQAYFAGRLTTFDVPLAPHGTPFQLRVWQRLRAIPYGETRSYRQLAEAMGQPTATRAVGAANGRNPISIIVPCHRVIGADGSLTGFGGGLDVKRWLLELEGGLTPRLAL